MNSLIAELRSSRTTPARRAEIGRLLACEDDVRPGVGLKDGNPDILWREVPGGVVEIQGHGRFPVEPFAMAAYPVTQVQYQAFFDAGDGYKDPRWWQHPAERKWLPPVSPFREAPNQPRDNVDWDEARAFCLWLSERLGYATRLPHESEWQWAAQSGVAGQRYPWGHRWRQHAAATAEAGLDGAIAVGMHPAGTSRQGVEDLVGNVLEWCRNSFEDPTDLDPKGDVPRPVRGGSWADNRSIANAEARLGFVPLTRFFHLGFRVVKAGD